ncbi:hypothetical protein HWV62_32112 [Athelia sp. TMB]|nr:hypothetical protein HWV62_32112 [Athelia sp. TMB]
MASHPYLPAAKEKGPARPPNAWIIYRKTKFRTLPPLQPGEPRRAQADVSKLISKMWREEPDAVKAEYERLAEAEKAAHQRMFPGYKFAPESKAEKEKKKKARQAQKEWERANARRSRGRAAPVVPPAVPLPAGLPPAAYYDPASLYGPAGPSPHTSGAGSPTSSKSGSLPLPPDPARSTSTRSSARSSPAVDAYHYPQHQEGTPDYGVPMPPMQQHHQPELAQQHHLPPIHNNYDQQEQFAPQQHHQQHHPQQQHHHLQPEHHQNPNQQQEHHQPQPQLTSWPQNPAHGDQVTVQGVTAQDVASYDHWDAHGGAPHHATAFATGDPAIFALEGLDFAALLERPQGPLEVSMGAQMPYDFAGAGGEGDGFAGLAQMFAEFEYAGPFDFGAGVVGGEGGEQGGGQGQGQGGGQGRQVSAQHASTPAAYYPDPDTPAASPPFYEAASRTPSYGQDAFTQYFNLDASEPSPPGSRHASGAYAPPEMQPQSRHASGAYAQPEMQPQSRHASGAYAPPEMQSTSRHASGSMYPPPEALPPSRHASASMYPSPEPPQYIPQEQHQQQQYTPPVVTNAGARRVGASWKPPRAEDDAPLEAWAYPVAARS